MSLPRSSLTGTRIRARRTVLGVAQAELARQVGVSPSYLNLIEHNRRGVGAALLDRLASALEVPVDTLREGAGTQLVETLREAAAAAPAHHPAPPEADRIEDFVGRFPGWADLIAAQQRRIGALERTVERLTDRMAHDPHLSAALHELLSVSASLRSTATILAEAREIDPGWQARFLGNIETDSLRLSEGAQALVGYLEAAEPAESGLAAPQEELEAWLADRGWHLPELEAAGFDAAGPEVDEMLAGHGELGSASAIALARAYLARARADAVALPLPRVLEALARVGPKPPDLAEVLGVGSDLPRLFRRLASLPDGVPGLPPRGLVICDGSGTLTFRRPLPGFGLPRFGGACPLWPLYQALAAPLRPVEQVVEMSGRPARRFVAYAVCEAQGGARFGAPAVLEATMLLLPAASVETDAMAPALPVGTSCRICPRAGCAARREPALVGGT